MPESDQPIPTRVLLEEIRYVRKRVDGTGKQIDELVESIQKLDRRVTRVEVKASILGTIGGLLAGIASHFGLQIGGGA